MTPAPVGKRLTLGIDAATFALYLKGLQIRNVIIK